MAPPSAGRKSSVLAFFGRHRRRFLIRNRKLPLLQETRTLDVCAVIEGEVVLVLDTREVALTAGEMLVQRGTRHAWSNRSAGPAAVAIASHDGAY